MKYCYTDENSVNVAVTLTLSEVETIRLMIARILELEAMPQGLSKWPLREMDKAMASVQTSSADTLEYQVNNLRRIAKREE